MRIGQTLQTQSGMGICTNGRGGDLSRHDNITAKIRGTDLSRRNTIAAEMNREVGFENVLVTDVRDLIKGRYKSAGRPSRKGA